MKNLIVYTSLLFLILVSSTAFAQDKKYEIRLGGGVSPLLRPVRLQDAYKLGFNIGGGFGIFFNSQLMVGGEFFYSKSSLEVGVGTANVATGEIIDIEVKDRDLNMFEILAVLKYYFRPVSESLLNFYVLGGIGLSNVDLAGARFSVGGNGISIPGFSETPGMLAVGAGIRFGSVRKFFIEGRIHAVFTDTEFISSDTIILFPVSAGIVF